MQPSRTATWAAGSQSAGRAGPGALHNLYVQDLAASQASVEKAAGKMVQAVFSYLPTAGASALPTPAVTSWQSGPIAEHQPAVGRRGGSQGNYRGHGLFILPNE